MEAIAANKVLFFNSNSFKRYHHRHDYRHRFVCYLQSKDNHQFKLVTSQETHIVKPILKAPKPKPKRIPKLVELTVQSLFVTAVVGSGWIYNVILPKKYNLMITDSTEFSNSQFDSVVASAYISGEFEILIVVMLFFTLKLIFIHEDECKKNGNRMRLAFKVVGVIIICVFVGCSLRLVSLAHVRDTWLSTRGHGPWHLILVLFFIVLNITSFGACAIEDIHQVDDRSHKRSRRPLVKSRRRRIIVLNKHLGRVSGQGGHIRSLAEDRSCRVEMTCTLDAHVIILLLMIDSLSLDETDGSLASCTGEAYDLGFRDAIPISALV
ncbi:uncharacterized protein LOC141612835 [Silene latifolia]|uniref:uncharacterized protein LOC141612835 n=1 Tax=Silene latifolia TaxID=37657 RepID=UPI003D77D71C